jgi:hypothetical protein
MKKSLKRLSGFTYSVMPVTALIFAAWTTPGNNYHVHKEGNIIQVDTTPDAQQGFDKTMKQLDINLDNLDVQMKNLNINLDKQLDAIAKINIEDIQKQTEASIKAIDWNKIQQSTNESFKAVQNEIAKIDFSKMQNEMKELQQKMQSDEFKSQFNSDKMHKEINDAMAKAQAGISKANEKLQQMKAFTDALAADGLIDKKKGYTIEWKEGDLYINGKGQPKNISDKYRKYEQEGKIKILPEGAEHF